MVILNKEYARRGFFAFFSTEAGRKVTFFGAGTAMVALFVGNFTPHSLGLKYYKDFVQCYEGGVPKPVSEKVLKRVDRAAEKLNVSKHERRFIQPFTVVGLDMFQAGSTKYRFGMLLGIPANYEYESFNDINKNGIRFRDQEIDWNSASGKLLQQAIVLQDDEQIFGICKTILQGQSHRVLMNAIFPSVSFLMVYTAGNYLNNRMNFFARPMSLRMVMYTILGLFGLGIYFFMKDLNQVNSDADIDKQLCALGPEFVEAGVRFYDKILKKNMALRELLGDDTYTAKGNVNYLLRQKSLPLTMQKSFFEEKWKELQQSGQASEVAN